MEKGFRVLIQNRARFENGDPAGRWMELPATKEELREVMETLGIAGPRDFLLNGYTALADRHVDVPQEWIRGADLDRVNFLAARLEGLDAEQLEKLNAVLSGSFQLDSLDKLIDYTYNEGCFDHIPGIYDAAELGDYYLNDSSMVQMPEAWKAGIDKEDFGNNAAVCENGKFTDYGYVKRNRQEWRLQYEGKEVPKQYQIIGYPEMDREQLREGITEPVRIKPIILMAENSKGRMAEITDRLEQGIQDLFQSEKYKNHLNVMSKFHHYSARNIELIFMQMPGASIIAGYNTWKQQGRQVMAGQKGLKIIAPSPYKIKRNVTQMDEKTQRPVIGKDGKPVTKEVEVTVPAYKVVTVFDVSQTEGRELPKLATELTGNVEDYHNLFKAVEQISPFPVSFEKTEGAHGYCHYGEKRIVLNTGMSETQNIKTFIHEIAHAKLHDKNLESAHGEQRKIPDQHTREVEAESVAYSVCQYLGLDTSEYSFGYIAAWSSGKEISELKESLEVIRNTSAELIEGINANYAEIMKDQLQQRTSGNYHKQSAEQPGKSVSIKDRLAANKEFIKRQESRKSLGTMEKPGREEMER